MKALPFHLGAAAALMVSAAAQAQQLPVAPGAEGYRPYIGIGVGIADNLTTRAHQAAPKIFAGIDFANNLGVEAGYVKFSSRDRTYDDYSAGAQGGLKVGARGYGAYVAAKNMVPLDERIQGYGKVGLAHSQREWGIDSAYRSKYIDNDVYAGLGAQYRINHNISVVGEYENYGRQKEVGARAGVLSAGVKLGF